MSYDNISTEYLHECFVLRDDGVLIWRTRPKEHFTSDRVRKSWNSKNAGKEAGNLHPRGYVHIHINRRPLKAHRIVWAMSTGTWPIEEIDHRNGIRNDNRLENLREASGSGEQKQNQKLYDNNTSGFPGVSWHRQRQQWYASIGFKGRRIMLGLFDAPEEAYAAYLAAKKKLHTFQPEPREETKKENHYGLY